MIKKVIIVNLHVKNDEYYNEEKKGCGKNWEMYDSESKSCKSICPEGEKYNE